MSRTVVTHLVDDLDGSEASETVQFSLDGAQFEIDLNAKNAAALRKAFERYTSAGRKSSSAKGRRRAGAARGGIDPKVVREWANSKKITISTRGRIPADVIERYRAAHAK